jgi:hypothetical protein
MKTLQSSNSINIHRSMCFHRPILYTIVHYFKPINKVFQRNKFVNIF